MINYLVEKENCVWERKSNFRKSIFTEEKAFVRLLKSHAKQMSGYGNQDKTSHITLLAV